VPNVLRADVLWQLSTDTSVSTKLHFRYSGGPPNASDAVALAADIYNPTAAMKALWDVDTFLNGVKVTDLSSPTGGQGEHASGTQGTNGGEVLPASAAAMVNYIITRRYRGGKPRSYWPFGTAGDIATRQTWQAVFTTSVDSHLATYFAAILGLVAGTTTITEHVNVSYYSGNKVVVDPITGRARNVPQLRAAPLVDAIVSFGTNARVGSQRRRN
jgi:hypothetical protein